MTEKDAVKCLRFARPGWWYVELDVEFEPPSPAERAAGAGAGGLASQSGQSEVNVG